MHTLCYFKKYSYKKFEMDYQKIDVFLLFLHSRSTYILLSVRVILVFQHLGVDL